MALAKEAFKTARKDTSRPDDFQTPERFRLYVSRQSGESAFSNAAVSAFSEAVIERSGRQKWAELTHSDSFSKP